MENAIIVTILQALSAAERRSLRKFLHSPYHNKREDLQTLFDYLTASDNPVLDREVVFEHLFPGAPFDATALNHTVSLLTKRIEHWLALEEAQEDPFSWDIFLARAYRRRSLSKLLQRTVQGANKALSAQAYRHSRYYRALADLQEEGLFVLQQQSRMEVLPLNALFDTLDVALMAEKLRLGCLMASYRNVARKEHRPGLLEVILEFLDLHPDYLKTPVVAAYYHGYLTQTAADPEPHFHALNALLDRRDTWLPGDELHNIYLIAVNFCIKKINLGEEKWLYTIFHLYQKGLDAGVFMESGRLSRWSFNNIVSAAIRVRELDWAKTFMQHYAERLDSGVRAATCVFNLARVFYEEKNYGEALRLLHQMEHGDVLDVLNAKALRMKLFYKLGEWQALDSLLDSITVYLRRNKILGYHKENFSNTVGAMRKLIALNHYDPAAREAFAQAVSAYRVLTERKWFLEQVAG